DHRALGGEVADDRVGGGQADRGRRHQGSFTDVTASHRPDSHERRSASCTLTYSTASAKPGTKARPSATAHRNWWSSIVTRSSKPMALALPGTKRPWKGKRSPPNNLVYPDGSPSWWRCTRSSFMRSKFHAIEPSVPWISNAFWLSGPTIDRDVSNV